jgi:hypothetical protein
VYAASAIGFVISTFLFDIGQTIFSALLFMAVFAVAWSASREASKQYDKAEISPELGSGPA